MWVTGACVSRVYVQLHNSRLAPPSYLLHHLLLLLVRRVRESVREKERWNLGGRCVCHCVALSKASKTVRRHFESLSRRAAPLTARVTHFYDTCARESLKSHSNCRNHIQIAESVFKFQKRITPMGPAVPRGVQCFSSYLLLTPKINRLLIFLCRRGR